MLRARGRIGLQRGESSGDALLAAPRASARPSRGRIVAARALLVLGVLLTVVTILSTYVKREALDEGQFKQTSQELIASPEIQQQVAAALVDGLYANVDVSGELTGKLPENLQGIAAPLAGASRELVDRGAVQLLQRPRAQATFVTLATAAQQQLIKVLHGDTRLVQSTNGDVVLDLQPLVLRLGEHFGFVQNLSEKLPPDAAQVTIINSKKLDTAQTITHWLEQIANWIWVLALACWAGAIWLARGRRRQEVRSLGIGLIVVGLLVLACRWLAGKYIVDQVVQADSVRPAVQDAWQIITDSLAAAGWVAFAVGVLTAVGAWFVGPRQRARAAREAVTPVMRRWEIAWGAWVVLMAIIIWILPIEIFRTTAILIVLSAIGFAVFRHQVQAEAAAVTAAVEQPAPKESAPPPTV